MKKPDRGKTQAERVAGICERSLVFTLMGHSATMAGGVVIDFADRGIPPPIELDRVVHESSGRLSRFVGKYSDNSILTLIVDPHNGMGYLKPGLCN